MIFSCLYNLSCEPNNRVPMVQASLLEAVLHSAFVELRFADGPRFPVEDAACFGRVVRQAFGQRRKMLRNSLMGLNPEGGRDWLEGLGERAGIELTRRPEELSIEEFIRLSDACTNLGEEAS